MNNEVEQQLTRVLIEWMPRKAEMDKHPRVIEALKQVGCYVHRGGFYRDPIGGMFMRNPLMAIWHESEVPTTDEITTIGKIIQGRIEKLFPDITEEFTAPGANMVTIKKTDGLWSFRKATWESGPTWYPNPGTLEELEGKF